MFGFDLMYMIAGLPGLIIAMSLHEYAHARVRWPWAILHRA